MKIIKRGTKATKARVKPRTTKWSQTVHCQLKIGGGDLICGAIFIVTKKDIKIITEDHDRYVDVSYKVTCPSCNKTGTFR